MESNAAQDLRYAPPRAHVEDVDAQAGQLVPAGRGQRFWAAMVDVAVAVTGTWIASMVTPWDPWAETGASMWAPDVLDAAIGFLLFLALQGLLLARRGQTIGKAALGIRITTPEGGAVPLGRLIGLRYGVGYVLNVVLAVGTVFGLIDALMIFRKSRRCLHDVIANTVVLKA